MDRHRWKSTLLLAPVLIYYVLMRLRLVVETRFRNEALGGIFPGITPVAPPQADTEDEAIQNAKEALELWFEPTPVDLPGRRDKVSGSCASA